MYILLYCVVFMLICPTGLFCIGGGVGIMANGY
jgi:hypothetical protein